jgi:hypothetical protein
VFGKDKMPTGLIKRARLSSIPGPWRPRRQSLINDTENAFRSVGDRGDFVCYLAAFRNGLVGRMFC